MTQADSPVADQPKKKAKKAPRLKAALPRGFQDRALGDLRVQTVMLEKIRAVFERYGFDPIETPAIEFTDALGKFLPDQDRPNEGVFSFQDDDERWLSLRYDLTAPLARYVAENLERLPKPYRSYRAGYVFRNEKPGPGRFRQFMQFDADTVGAPVGVADAEMAMLMADTMEAVGIEKGDYVIRVNNRKVLDGVMEAIGLGGDENAGTRLQVMRSIDKLDRVGIEGVRQLLGKEGRVDESGDHMPGVGLEPRQVDRLIVFQSLQSGNVIPLEDVTNLSPGQRAEKGEVLRFSSTDEDDDSSYFVESNKGIVDALEVHFGSNPMSREGVAELRRIAELVEAAGYERDRIAIDPSVVRGLEYYTGPVFEAELTFETVNEKGEKARYGSVAGGGRYDGLVSRFTGQDVPATGFSIGVSRLQAALTALDRVDAGAGAGPVVVTVMDRDQLPAYQRMVTELRNAGIRAEMFVGNPKQFGKQLQYADRRSSPCVIIQGSDEREAGTVQIKDLIEGARIAANIDSHEEYKAARPAQVTVAEADLVAEVQRILDHHGLDRGLDHHGASDG